MKFQDEIDEKITITISGNAMDKDSGFDLRYLIQFLSSIESLIEKTYLYSNERNRMTEEDYKNLEVIISNTRRGSFEADVVIQLQRTALALSPLVASNGKFIWKIITESYEYLKLLIDTKKAGKTVEVTHDNDGINVIGNNNTITINNSVPDLSNNLLPIFSQMAKNIDGDKIKGITLSAIEGSDLTLTEKDKKIFKSQILLNEEIFTIDGEIVVSDSERYKGYIKIHQNQQIPSGTYPFEVTEGIKDKEIFKKSYLSKVKIKCQKRVKVDPTKSNEDMIETIGLKILDIQII